jgi:hypothetical protein
LAAWILSAIGYAAPNIHSLFIESSNQHWQLLLLSLGIWPIIMALPAFLVALAPTARMAVKHTTTIIAMKRL